MNDDDIKLCVSWWSKFLKEDFEFDNGDKSQSTFANINKHLMDMPTIIQIAVFENSLFNIIKNNLKRNLDVLFLEVDYDPCNLLRQALEDAEIKFNFSILPCKTSMIISEKKIEVKQGYGAQFINIKG